MKNKKNGFILVEAIIAVLVIGVSATVIYGFQSNLFRSVFYSHGILERVFLVQNYFSESDREMLYKKKEKATKKVQDPESTLNYNLNKLTDPKLSKIFKNIYFESIKISWSGIFKGEESFGTFRFIPKTEEKV